MPLGVRTLSSSTFQEPSRVAHQVAAGDVAVDAAGRPDPVRGARERRARHDELPRHDPRVDDLARVVDVVDELVQRADALRQAALDRRATPSAGMMRGTRSSGNGRSRTGPSASGPPASKVIPCCMKIASRRRPASDERLRPQLGERRRERHRVLARPPRRGEHLVVAFLHPRCILTRPGGFAKRPRVERGAGRFAPRSTYGARDALRRDDRGPGGRHLGGLARARARLRAARASRRCSAPTTTRSVDGGRAARLARRLGRRSAALAAVTSTAAARHARLAGHVPPSRPCWPRRRSPPTTSPAGRVELGIGTGWNERRAPRLRVPVPADEGADGPARRAARDHRAARSRTGRSPSAASTTRSRSSTRCPSPSSGRCRC